MTYLNQLLFRLDHFDNDAWGHPNRQRQADRDLARGVMTLLDRQDVHLEDLLACAFARHRSGLKMVGEEL